MSLFDEIDRVTWSTGPSSRLLAARGVAHGFLGRTAEAAMAGKHWARQVHGTRIVEASAGVTSEDAAERASADGVITSTRGLRVAVKTADCLPVLLAGRAAVVAVHAGWRGLTAGILGVAVQELVRRGEAAPEIVAVVGPAISREKYEVGREVAQALASPELGLAPEAWALTVAKGHGDRWHADLPLAAVLTLRAHGLLPEHLEVVQACTTDDAWHSYRRDGSVRGSNIHFIAL